MASLETMLIVTRSHSNLRNQKFSGCSENMQFLKDVYEVSAMHCLQ